MLSLPLFTIRVTYLWPKVLGNSFQTSKEIYKQKVMHESQDTLALVHNLLLDGAWRLMPRGTSCISYHCRMGRDRYGQFSLVP
jgi:hypothetical protein